MKTNDTYYDFHESYEKDWRKFITQFPYDYKLEEESITLEIKQCCCKMDRLIRDLYEQNPEYSSQREIRWQWRTLECILEEHETIYTEKALSWFVRQVMNMIICSNSKIVESIWYAIGVDYFECGTEGSWLFPKMYKELPEREIKKLIQYSVSIPWKDKVETYKEMVSNNGHHEMLADALYHSCKAYCHGSAKSSEAMKILKQLTIPGLLYNQASKILTTPYKVEILEVIELKKVSDDGITGFVSIHHYTDTFGIPTWFPNAELWIANTYIGTFGEDYFRIRWDSISSIYGVSTPKTQHHQEHILCINIPFGKDWNNKTGILKPI